MRKKASQVTYVGGEPLTAVLRKGKAVRTGKHKRKRRRKAIRWEQRARVLLQAAGFYTLETNGMLPPFDLLAFNEKGLRLIQVRFRGPTPAERAALEQFPAFFYCTREIWTFSAGQWQPVVETLDDTSGTQEEAALPQGERTDVPESGTVSPRARHADKKMLAEIARGLAQRKTAG
jgi:hypothetical protein